MDTTGCTVKTQLPLRFEVPWLPGDCVTWRTPRVRDCQVAEYKEGEREGVRSANKIGLLLLICFRALALLFVREQSRPRELLL